MAGGGRATSRGIPQVSSRGDKKFSNQSHDIVGSSAFVFLSPEMSDGAWDGRVGVVVASSADQTRADGVTAELSPYPYQQRRWRRPYLSPDRGDTEIDMRTEYIHDMMDATRRQQPDVPLPFALLFLLHLLLHSSSRRRPNEKSPRVRAALPPRSCRREQRDDIPVVQPS